MGQVNLISTGRVAVWSPYCVPLLYRHPFRWKLVSLQMRWWQTMSWLSTDIANPSIPIGIPSSTVVTGLYTRRLGWHILSLHSLATDMCHSYWINTGTAHTGQIVHFSRHTRDDWDHISLCHPIVCAWNSIKGTFLLGCVVLPLVCLLALLDYLVRAWTR